MSREHPSDAKRAVTMEPDVRAAFDRHPPEVRDHLLALRRIILEVADETEGVGPLDEALRWGEPAYLTSESGSGSTVRLGTLRDQPDRPAVLFICHTGLVEQFRQMFGDRLDFDGDRAIVLDGAVPRAVDEPLRECIAMALTYHLAKRR